MSDGRREGERQHAGDSEEQEALASGGDFGRGDRDGHVEGFDPEDHGGNYDPSFGSSPRAFARYSGDEPPAYGGGGREAYGGGEAGRGTDGEAPDPGSAPNAPASGGGGTSGASSAIGDGTERRAASGGSGSVSEEPTAAGGAAQGDTGSEGSGAMGNASGPNRTDTAPTTGAAR